MANRSEAEKNAAITALTLAASINPIVIHITDAIQHHGPFYALTALVESTIDVSSCDTNVELDASGSVLAYAKPGTVVTVD